MEKCSLRDLPGLIMPRRRQNSAGWQVVSARQSGKLPVMMSIYDGSGPPVTGIPGGTAGLEMNAAGPV